MSDGSENAKFPALGHGPCQSLGHGNAEPVRTTYARYRLGHGVDSAAAAGATTATTTSPLAVRYYMFGHGNTLEQCDEQTGPVVVTKDEYDLTFVDDVMEIDSGVTSRTETVPVFIMKNDVGIEVMAMPRGGTLLKLKKNGKEFLWQNANAAYYGDQPQNNNSFALKRGIVLNGGCRFTCVAPEHGIYFDTDWHMEWKANNSSGTSKSIVLWIQDTPEQRARLDDPGSTGNFARTDMPDIGLSKYPVTNLVYKFTITLNAGEEYVHLQLSVENLTDHDAKAEAWLPMMLPAERDSQIITQQKMMWRRDEWCFPEQANMIDYVHDPVIKYPLHWEKMGIYYTWPKLDGCYHGVNMPSTGQGTIFVTDPSQPTFMKLWSWGDRKNFVRKPDGTDNGRPHTEYYECWCSNTSPAFFETSVFPAHRNLEYNCALLPIECGLDADLDNQQLQLAVEAAILKARIHVVNGPAVNVTPSAK